MATAYVANINAVYADGYSENIAVTADDVNGNNWLGQDGLSPIRFSAAHGNFIIRDIIINPAPTSTRTATIRVNSRLIPDVVLLGANIGTVVGRQFMGVPLRMPQGANIQFSQVT
jgi:hypothetical protein